MGGGLEQKSADQMVCVKREERGVGHSDPWGQSRKERSEGGNALKFGKPRGWKKNERLGTMTLPPTKLLRCAELNKQEERAYHGFEVTDLSGEH